MLGVFIFHSFYLHTSLYVDDTKNYQWELNIAHHAETITHTYMYMTYSPIFFIRIDNTLETKRRSAPYMVGFCDQVHATISV